MDELDLVLASHAAAHQFRKVAGVINTDCEDIMLRYMRAIYPDGGIRAPEPITYNEILEFAYRLMVQSSFLVAVITFQRDVATRLQAEHDEYRHHGAWRISRLINQLPTPPGYWEQYRFDTMELFWWTAPRLIYYRVGTVEDFQRMMDELKRSPAYLMVPGPHAVEVIDGMVRGAEGLTPYPKGDSRR